MLRNTILPQENIEILRQIKLKKGVEIEAVTVGDFSVEVHDGAWKNKRSISFKKNEYLILTKTNKGVTLRQEHALVSISWKQFLEIKTYILPLLGMRIILN